MQALIILLSDRNYINVEHQTYSQEQIICYLATRLTGSTLNATVNYPNQCTYQYLFASMPKQQFKIDIQIENQSRIQFLGVCYFASNVTIRNSEIKIRFANQKNNRQSADSLQIIGQNCQYVSVFECEFHYNLDIVYNFSLIRHCIAFDAKRVRSFINLTQAFYCAAIGQTVNKVVLNSSLFDLRAFKMAPSDAKTNLVNMVLMYIEIEKIQMLQQLQQRQGRTVEFVDFDEFIADKKLDMLCKVYRQVMSAAFDEIRLVDNCSLNTTLIQADMETEAQAAGVFYGVFQNMTTSEYRLSFVEMFLDIKTRTHQPSSLVILTLVDTNVQFIRCRIGGQFQYYNLTNKLLVWKRENSIVEKKWTTVQWEDYVDMW